VPSISHHQSWAGGFADVGTMCTSPFTGVAGDWLAAGSEHRGLLAQPAANQRSRGDGCYGCRSLRSALRWLTLPSGARACVSTCTQ
jgi:hypothetical protein